MNYIDFDKNNGILYNAWNASVFQDFIISDLVADYGTDISVLLSKCGLTLLSGTANLVQTSGHYKMVITSTSMTIGISYAICGIKFNDRTGVNTFFGQGQNKNSVNLSAGVYGFDELNILLNPNYLYRRNNQPYFYQLGRCTNAFSPRRFDPIILESITPSYVQEIYPSLNTKGVQYAMPNYQIGNLDIISVGHYDEPIGGTNPFKYQGKVFGLARETPPNYFCYQEFVPEIIYIDRYTDNAGFYCDHYVLTNNGIDVYGMKNGTTNIVHYPIDSSHKLVRYRRINDSSHCTIKVSKKSGRTTTYYNFTPTNYFQFLDGSGYNDYRVIWLGERNSNTSSIPIDVHYKISMITEEFNGSVFVEVTNDLYNQIKTTYNLSASYTTGTTTGDGAKNYTIDMTLGRSGLKDSEKYATKYSITLNAEIEQVLNVPTSLPPSTAHAGVTAPHINSGTDGTTETVYYPPRVEHPIDNPAVSRICNTAIQGKYRFYGLSGDGAALATVPQQIKLSQAQQQCKGTYYPSDANVVKTILIKQGETSNGSCYGTHQGESGYCRAHGANDTFIFDDFPTKGDDSYYDSGYARRFKIDCSQVALGTIDQETFTVLVLGRNDGYMNPYDD